MGATTPSRPTAGPVQALATMPPGRRVTAERGCDAVAVELLTAAAVWWPGFVRRRRPAGP